MFIKVSNDGVLDVPVACNMLGASVKEKAGAIGIFGSGLKYALAQACRDGIKLHVASGENVFRITTKPQEFRGKIFEKVVLQDIKTDRIFETPITTDFGAQDWKDPWYIYREIVCNALDEQGFRISVVDEIRRSTKETSFYLPYENFSEIHGDYSKYFTSENGDWIKAGTGIIYKRGVRVGQLEDLNLDCQIADIEITETRTVKEYSAYWRIGSLLNCCRDVDIWAAFLSSGLREKIDISILHANDAVVKAFNAGCKKVFGEYAISPDLESIVKDLQEVGVHPLVIPSGWILPLNKLPNFKDKIRLDNNEIRNPTTKEEEMIQWGLKTASVFGMRTNVEVKVFKSDKALYGMQGGSVTYIREDKFSNKKDFLHILFHELGHKETGASDYDRQFADYFVGKIVDFVIS